MPESDTYFELLTYSQLTVDQLYSIARLRQNVFVVEQKCCYEDLDNLDRLAAHLLGTDKQGQLVAYCRIFGPGDRYDEPSIGRVLTLESHRGCGIGHELIGVT